MNTKDIMNTKDVVIKIFGLQDPEGVVEDDLEFVTDGRYSFKNGVATFSYLESALTGLEGTRTTFKASPDEVVITRDGTVTMQMVFSEGRRHNFMYNTPFGAFTMGIDTMSVLRDMDENGGKLEVDYLLDMDNTAASKNHFRISVREA